MLVTQLHAKITECEDETHVLKERWRNGFSSNFWHCVQLENGKRLRKKHNLEKLKNKTSRNKNRREKDGGFLKKKKETWPGDEALLCTSSMALETAVNGTAAYNHHQQIAETSEVLGLSVSL